jgi:cell division protein FtsI (penicillin-binding protein 3)
MDDEGKEVQHFEPQVVRRVISAETAGKITRMMETVTEEGGTGTKAAIDGFRVAGKTGTAQKVDPVTRTYSPSKRIGSFVGFVPADQPRLTIAVIIDEPQGVKYGGVIAAPAFRAIAQNTLAYLKVMPTVASARQPKTAGTGTAQARAGQELQQEALSEGDALEDTASGESVMPDFRGMSMRRVLQVMEKRSINIRLLGSGRAMEQSPSPGQVIRGGNAVWIRFAPAA